MQNQIYYEIHINSFIQPKVGIGEHKLALVPWQVVTTADDVDDELLESDPGLD